MSRRDSLSNGGKGRYEGGCEDDTQGIHGHDFSGCIGIVRIADADGVAAAGFGVGEFSLTIAAVALLAHFFARQWWIHIS